MKKILYLAAFILIAGWGIGITQYDPGPLINVMLYLGLTLLFMGVFNTWRRFLGAIGISCLITGSILFGEWSSFIFIGISCIAFILLARTGRKRYIY